MNDEENQRVSTTAHALEDKIPDATQNGLRYTTGARVCHHIKVGCSLLFDV